MDDEADRFKAGILVPTLLVAAFCVVMTVMAFAQKNWIPFAVAVAVVVISIGLFLAMGSRNLWRGFTPGPGQRFEPSTSELPAVADHRSVFGPGTIQNVLTGKDFTAFEIVRGPRRQWWFTVPLEGEHGHGRARIPLYENGTGVPGRPPFSERYYVEGQIPGPMRQILDKSDPRVDVQVDGDLLIATTRGMSPSRLPHWLAREGQIVERIAEALGRRGGGSVPDPPALGTGTPHEWQLAPDPTSAWVQPPAASAAATPKRPRDAKRPATGDAGR